MYQKAVQLLQPTVMTLRVCGVCPSALRRFHIPFSNKVYALFLALPPVLYFPLVATKIYNELNDITAFVKISGAVLVVVQHLTLIAASFLTSKTLVRFFMIVESAQQSLFDLNISQPHSPSTTSQIVWIILLFSPALTNVLIEIFHGGVFQPPAVFILALIKTGTICKMRVLMALVKEKFDLLNWHLDDLNNRWPLFLPRPPDVSFRELSCVAQWRRTRFVQESQDNRIVTAEKIRNFNKAHLKLHYASTTLNSVFNWESLLICLATGTTFIINVFNLFTGRYGERTVLLMIEACAFIVDDIIGLVVVLVLASKIQENSKRTALLVHDLLDEDRHPPEVVEELEQFSMALLHRQTYFSAAGFFNLDLKLVSKMASILAPIILFLVQNDNRPRAGRNKINST